MKEMMVKKDTTTDQIMHFLLHFTVVLYELFAYGCSCGSLALSFMDCGACEHLVLL
uniref:Uncharacterized protein n=1 Tax=Rhizophora mucronata TaxID=61149 RepID=A0A2P2PS70_RHIMU